MDTAPAEEAEQWGITADAVSAITRESDKFAAAIATRAGQTAALRPKFRAVSDQLNDLDRFIFHFAGAPESDAMIAAYQNARNIIDLGSGSTARSVGVAGIVPDTSAFGDTAQLEPGRNP